MMHRRWPATMALLALAVIPACTPASPVLASRALQDPTCVVTVDKTAAPSQIRLGETVTVTLQVGATCPEMEHPADVILAIDHSESMSASDKLAAAQAAAITFVNRMDPSLVRVGIVSVSRTAPLIQGLTTDRALLVAAIQGLQNERGTNIVAGLDASRAELTGSNARSGARKVIVFLTDGKHTVSSPPISDLDGVIAAVRAAGIEVFAIGLGSDADEATLRRMASDDAHYYFSPTSGDLEAIYIQIAGRTQAAVLLAASSIADVLPANMEYVPGYGAPAEPAFDAPSRTLRWSASDVTAADESRSYRVRPTETGTWPTNVTAVLDYVDGFGNAGSKVFPIPVVRVIDDNPVNASCVCRIVLERVPGVVIADALANPQRYYGWQYPLDPGKPRSPANPPRECLTLANVNTDYHPLWNAPLWRVGCP